jgi:hypothetical protein
VAVIRHVFSLFAVAVLVRLSMWDIWPTPAEDTTTSEEILKQGSEQRQKLKVEEMRENGERALKDL